MNAHDAIVIGAGLNGLVAAAYLARAGRKVLVLERRAVIGGAAATEEVFPGFKFDVVTHNLTGFSDAILRDLALARRGVEFIDADPAATIPLDGANLTLWRDAARTADSIRRFSPRDAERWHKFAGWITKLAGFVENISNAPPPRVTTLDLTNARILGSLGLKMRLLGKKEMVEGLRALPMPAADWLDEWFETDALKSLIGSSGVTGLSQGPKAAGTTLLLLHHHVGGRGVVRPTRFVRGGLSRLAAGLAAAIQAQGSQVRTDAAVEHILLKDGRASGVVLSNGEEIAARAVLSTADPRETFLKLVDPGELDPSFIHAVRHIKFRGSTAKVNLALDALPSFKGLEPTHLRGVLCLSPSLDYIERAYDASKYGALSAQPYLEVTIPTLSDPSRAPEGKHVMSVLVQYAPYQLKTGNWDEQRDLLGERVLDVLSAYAPDLRSHLYAMQVLTPLDLEQTYGLPEGNLNHGELMLDQFFFMRPVPGYAYYRTPIESLYFGGGGAHPAGVVAGGAGRNAARAMMT